MPSVSKKQHNLMALVANDPKAAKRLGIPRSVGEEFMKADKGKKFGGGGMALKSVDKDENPGLSKLPEGVRNKMGYMKKGGIAKTVTKEMEYDYKTGKKSFRGDTAERDRHAEKEGKIVAKHAAYDKAKGMKKGGMAHSDIAKDKPMMKKVAKAEVKAHEKKMHKMAGGGKVGQLSKADGCAVKGKSKGKMIKMAYGGKC